MAIVDVIPVEPLELDDMDVDGLDLGQQLFVIAHRWAIETANSATATASAGARAHPGVVGFEPVPHGPLLEPGDAESRFVAR